MSLVEEALRRTPEARLEEHQRALNLVLEIVAARENLQQARSQSRTAAGISLMAWGSLGFALVSPPPGP
jgi:hypothetical protein